MTPIARISALLAVFTVSQIFSLAAFAHSPDCGSFEAAPDRYIIRALHSSNSVQEKSVSTLTSVMQRKSTTVIHQPAASAFLSQSSLSVVTLAVSVAPDELDALKSDRSVLSVEPDCLIPVSDLTATSPSVTANNAWAYRSLNLEAAWSLDFPSSPTVIAISDTGVDLSHPDLATHLWTNQKELSGLAGYDDDQDGCVDDLHGCDLADHDGDPSPGPSSDNDHGTHVAGIVNQVARGELILASKGFSNSGGGALSSDLLRSLYYAVNEGARVINCSWGIDRAPTAAETEAFQYGIAHGALPIVAAGNSSVDAANTSPAAIPGVLTVGSINSQDQVSSFSNFGTVVSVYAPGGDAISKGGFADEFIRSTLPVAHGSYGNMRGTSMAAPFVTGIATLILSARPSLSPNQLRDLIIKTSRTAHVGKPVSDILVPDAFAALSAALALPQLSAAPTNESSKPIDSPSALVPSTATKPGPDGGCGLSANEFTNASLGERGVLFLILFLPLGCAWLFKRRDV